ncbi:MAG: YtxH domain-containing protein [Chloroflexota bacterium]
MSRMFSFLVGVVIGGMVGSVTALLLAPASGSELQSQLRERADYIQLEVRKAASEKRIELEQQLAGLRAPTSPQIEE